MKGVVLLEVPDISHDPSDGVVYLYYQGAFSMLISLKAPTVVSFLPNAAERLGGAYRRLTPNLRTM